MNFQLSNLLKATRQYFWRKNFTEVEIPYLNSSLPLEPNIYSFNTVWQHTHAKFYLPTSPEFALKKHLSENKTNCFAISHCFRDLEAESSHHTKEFLMLEWYEVGQDLNGLMKSVEEYISQFINLKFSKFILPANLPNNEPDFNQYFLNEIEPNLPRRGAVFITGYPAFLSPLAKVSEANKFFRAQSSEGFIPEGREHGKISLASENLAQRFELYINGIEIANGCTENTNAEQIKTAFETEKKYRLNHHLPLHPYSEEFITNSASLPPCSGIGLGLDRLLKLI